MRRVLREDLTRICAYWGVASLLLAVIVPGCTGQITGEPTKLVEPTTIAQPVSLTPTRTPTVAPSPTRTATPSPTPQRPTPTPAPPPLPPLITAGRPETGVVALTFDQGVKGPGETPRVLDILREARASSTFFVIGVWAENNLDLLRRMVAEGHELANHTYDHPDLRQISDQQIAEQLEHTERIVQQAVGESTKPYMRPPSSAYDDRVLAAVNRLGYTMVCWSLDSTDWRAESTPASVVEWVVGKAKPGDIIVFHGYSPKTAAALPDIVRGLKQKGYRLGTVSQVLGR